MKNLIACLLFTSLAVAASAFTDAVDEKTLVQDLAAWRLTTGGLDVDVETFGQQVVYSVLPRYPTELRRAGIAGSATVDLVVEETGKVSSAAVLHASHRAFGVEAVESVCEWRFAPAHELGKAGPRQFRVRINFVLVGTI